MDAETLAARLTVVELRLTRLRATLAALCHAVEHGRSLREPWNKAMAALGPNVRANLDPTA